MRNIIDMLWHILSRYIDVLWQNLILIAILIGLTLGILEIYLLRKLLVRRLRDRMAHEKSEAVEVSPQFMAEKGEVEEVVEPTSGAKALDTEEAQGLIKEAEEPTSQPQEGEVERPQIPEHLKKVVKSVKVLPTSEAVHEELPEESGREGDVTGEEEVERRERVVLHADIKSLLDSLRELKDEVMSLHEKLKNMRR